MIFTSFAEKEIERKGRSYDADMRKAKDENAKLMDQIEQIKETLATVMNQSESDLKSAHAEICTLQGLDPDKHTWPRWSPQANSLRWFVTIREKFGLETSFPLHDGNQP